MNHRNYDKENNIDRQTYYNSNRLESRSSVDIDISTLKIGHSKNANNREDRSTSQPNSRNSHINLEEGKSRSKSKGRSNSARRLQNRQPQQPQSQPQQPQTKQLVEDSNNNSNERREFTSSNKTHSLSSASGNRNGNSYAHSTNDMNSYSTSQKSSFKSSSSGPGSERNPSHHHRPSAYHHHHQPHSRGGYNAPPPAYNFNPTQHYMAPGPYFNPHIPPQINSAAGYGSGFNNRNNVPIYPTIEIHLTVRDHELFAAKQREACPSRPSSSIFRSAAPSPSSSPSKFNSHCRSEQPSHGPDSEEADLQKLLEQTWAETDEMLCDQRDNLTQFYEAVKQAQIARCARCLKPLTLIAFFVCVWLFNTLFFYLIQYCIMHNNISFAVGEVLFRYGLHDSSVFTLCMCNDMLSCLSIFFCIVLQLAECAVAGGAEVVPGQDQRLHVEDRGGFRLLMLMRQGRGAIFL